MNKAKKILHKKGYKVAFLMVSLVFAATSCTANPRTNAAETQAVSNDTVMRKAVGDSIYNIITKAKTVTATLNLKANDGKRDSTVNVKVGKNDKYVLNFILSAPSNYETNDIVYGKYVPNFTLNFIAAKGKSCSANFDFGLRKWNVCDADGKELVIYDLPTTDVLRLANILFPDCVYFKNLLNNKK